VAYSYSAHKSQRPATPGLTGAVRDSGVPAGFHPNELRHTAASLPGLSAAANVKAVQRMLGHAKASMTLNVYADLFDDDLEAVADRLDEVARRADFLRTGDVIMLPGPRPQAADVRFCGGDEGT
jgi:integrase